MSEETGNEKVLQKETVKNDNVDNNNNDENECTDNPGNDIEEIVRTFINNTLDKFIEINSKRNSIISTSSKLNRSNEENGMDLLRKEVQSVRQNVEKLDKHLKLHLMQQTNCEEKLSTLVVKLNEFENTSKPTLKQNRASFDCQDTKRKTERDLIEKNSVGTSMDDLIKTEEMNSLIERRQSQTKSLSNNKNGTRKLSHEYVDNNIHNRTNSEEDEWYTKQLEEIKHLTINEILQRILH
ncbi:hypothetical protein Smp_082410 [Schistosoma mansoni]|uniref:Syntaxin n=1 Tax=Schistosoma mansoni TaxID=6183 RepID=G4VGH8_SCHMA|nr:hypothetical protein Smp_082410 [Schistosoma mansoni]|eukprot:XP_018650716.1 hypothetical protein Smp_082410 [Schistosoma mansoni]